MTRAVVTGGAGFLGSHLCDRLVREDIATVCIDNLLTGDRGNLAQLAGHPLFEFIEADVTEPVEIPGAVDFVLHFASPASPIDYLRLPIETLRVGSLGTFHALDLARRKGARFLLASTSEVYGDPRVHPQPETYWGHVNPVGPRGVYDEAKRFAEALTMACRHSQGLDTGIVRIFNTFGPRMRPGDGRAIPTFIRQAITGCPITVAGDGSQTRSICYIEDQVDGIFRLLTSDQAGPMNIGNPHEVRVLELAERIRDLVGSDSPIAFIPKPEDDPRVRRPDITLAMRTLGWAPAVPTEEALLRTIGWFLDHPDLREPVPADGGTAGASPVQSLGAGAAGR